ncbi:gp449 [Bacillus phage G]|uniref:Gp449 n=1 Tax=Bacillus phage G TaxID=2884420 RepID=G3MAJ0_9CAUD|nr:gp449 [Bacillus phage G]AEO93707.1 gp449 [Bacillus phage G]
MYDFEGIEINITEDDKRVLILEEIRELSSKIKTKQSQINAYGKLFHNITVIVYLKDSQYFAFRLCLNESMEISNVTITENHALMVGKIDQMIRLSKIVDMMYVYQNEEMNEKLDIIRCLSEKCPICSSEVLKNRFGLNHARKCINGCYTTEYRENIKLLKIDVQLFDEADDVFFIKHGKTTLQDRINIINNLYSEILFWKENDRYLAKILVK